MQKGFRGLKVWQSAYSLALAVYKTTKSFPREEQYGLVSQIQRASVSVSANIAEGYERQYRKEYVQYLNIARGSLGEVETYLLFAKDLGYIREEQYNELEIIRQEAGRLLKGLIVSLVP